MSRHLWGNCKLSMSLKLFTWTLSAGFMIAFLVLSWLWPLMSFFRRLGLLMSFFRRLFPAFLLMRLFPFPFFLLRLYVYLVVLLGFRRVILQGKLLGRNQCECAAVSRFVSKVIVIFLPRTYSHSWGWITRLAPRLRSRYRCHFNWALSLMPA